MQSYRGEMARLQVCLELVVLASFYGEIPCRIISGDLAKRPGIIMTGARWCEMQPTPTHVAQVKLNCNCIMSQFNNY